MYKTPHRSNLRARAVRFFVVGVLSAGLEESNFDALQMFFLLLRVRVAVIPLFLVELSPLFLVEPLVLIMVALSSNNVNGITVRNVAATEIHDSHPLQLLSFRNPNLSIIFCHFSK